MLTCIYQSPQKSINYVPLILGITYVRQDVCMYVSIYVIAIVATPFNLQLWNFGTTFLMGLPKKGFLKFLKNIFLELLPSFCISLRLLCKFEDQ